MYPKALASDSAVYVNGGTATITNSSISRIPGYGVFAENQGELRIIQSRISNSGIVGIATNDGSRATISGSIVTGLPGLLIRGYGTCSSVSGNASLTNIVVAGNEAGVAGSASLLNSTVTVNLAAVSVSFGGSAQLSKSLNPETGYMSAVLTHLLMGSQVAYKQVTLTCSATAAYRVWRALRLVLQIFAPAGPLNAIN
jgi:hypothetical protein